MDNCIVFVFIGAFCATLLVFFPKYRKMSEKSKSQENWNFIKNHKIGKSRDGGQNQRCCMMVAAVGGWKMVCDGGQKSMWRRRRSLDSSRSGPIGGSRWVSRRRLVAPRWWWTFRCHVVVHTICYHDGGNHDGGDRTAVNWVVRWVRIGAGRWCFRQFSSLEVSSMISEQL